MTRSQLSTAAAIAAIAISILVPATARANHLQESIFQDDDHLLYSSTATVKRTLNVLRSLGVDRVRILVKWSVIAPNPGSRTRPPHFDAANPAAYPASSWLIYDRLVKLAAQRQIGVDFTVSVPGPLWAMKHNPPTARAADHYAPSVLEFAWFVEALGTRYSGHEPGIPRVHYWTIWNEPNQPGWLAPQSRVVNGRQVPNSPRLYREYVEAGIGGLFVTGHTVATDTVLIGETAPEGKPKLGWYTPITPMPFMRALYCVDAGYRPLRGSAAAALGCPTSGAATDFVAQNPALFYATGFAHHPYYFYYAPDISSPNPDFAPLANLGRLERGLDAAFRAYGVKRRLPIYLTEYGYQTNPPDPYQVVTPAEQATYLNEADFIAWHDPRVRAVGQFLLFDARPNSHYPPFSFDYWNTFQTGLRFAGGAYKPAYAAWRLPIWIPSPVLNRGSRTLLWGQIRPAADDTTQRAMIQWRPAGGAYRTIATSTVSGPEHYFTLRVGPPGSGQIRIAWAAASGATVLSRPVSVTVRP